MHLYNVGDCEIGGLYNYNKNGCICIILVIVKLPDDTIAFKLYAFVLSAVIAKLGKIQLQSNWMHFYNGSDCKKVEDANAIKLGGFV